MKKAMVFVLLFLFSVGLYGCGENHDKEVKSDPTAQTQSIYSETEGSQAGTEPADGSSVGSASKSSTIFVNSGKTSEKDTQQANSGVAVSSSSDKPDKSSDILYYPDTSAFITQNAFRVNNDVYTIQGYSDSDDRIIKINLSNRTVQVLEDELPTSMIVYRDHLYYSQRISQTLRSKICRMKLDGSGKEVLAEGYTDLLSIYKNKIYYSQAESSSSERVLYCMDLNGKNKKNLDCWGDYLSIFDDRIYYSSDHEICSVKLDGSDFKSYGIVNSNSLFCADAGFVYYFNDGPQGETLFRKRLQDGKTESLCTIYGSMFTLRGDQLYYIDMETGRLFRCGLNGAGKQKLFTGDVHTYSLQNEQLYAWGAPKGGKQIFYWKDLKKGTTGQLSVDSLFNGPTGDSDQPPAEELSEWKKPYDPKQILADCKTYVKNMNCFWVEEVKESAVKASKRFRTSQLTQSERPLDDQVRGYIVAYIISGSSRHFHVDIKPEPNSSGNYEITVYVFNRNV